MEEDFFIRAYSQFFAKHTGTGDYQATFLPSLDQFTSNIVELGYWDLFKKVQY